MMKFGAVCYDNNIQSYIDWCTLAEDLGFDRVCTGDSSTLWVDPYVILPLVAKETEKIRLGITVTNPVTRHPAVSASALAGLQHIADGRLFCGVGGGDSAVHNINLKPAKLAEIETYVLALQDLTSGREADYHGAKIKMQWKTRAVPIWMSAEGPKTLELAGRIADGVIIGSGITEDIVKASMAHIEKGARQAGRDPDSIEKFWSCKIHFAESREQGWADQRFINASAANKHFRFSFEGKFVPEELKEPIRRLQTEYAFHEHANYDKPGYNAGLVEKYGLTEFLGRRFSITGPADQIIEDIRNLASWGVKNLHVITLYADRTPYMHRLAKEVFPHVM